MNNEIQIKSALLSSLIRHLAADPRYTFDLIHAGTLDSDDLRACSSLALEAAWYCKEQRLDAALQCMRGAKSRFAVMPLPLLHIMTYLLGELGYSDSIALEYLEFGRACVDAGDNELGLEAICSGIFYDSIKAFHKIAHNPGLMLSGIEKFEKVAQAMGEIPGAKRESQHERLRVAMLVPTLIDNTVAFSKRVMFFARYLDTTRYDLRVYITEDFCRKYRLDHHASCPTSDIRAPAFMKELAERGVPVYRASTDSLIMDRARAVAAQMASDEIDILILQAGAAAVTDWLSARIAPVPAKIHIHIGGALMQTGVDVTLFDNAVNMEREAAEWPAYAGEMRLMRRGTDIAALDSVAAVPRSSLGIPGDAVVIGTLSNHLDKRMSFECADAIAGVLERNPSAWYMPVGVSTLPGRIVGAFRARGVIDRVKFQIPAKSPGSMLKVCDIYANEFPEGGSQSVIEAMVCRLPVAALRAGRTHHASIGADIVGPPYAVLANDPVAYANLIEMWIRDPAKRNEASAAMRKRAEEEFSVKDFVRKVCDLGREIFERKLQ